VVIRQMNISHDMPRVHNRLDAQGVSLQALKTRSSVAVATRARIDAGGGTLACVRSSDSPQPCA